MSIRNEPYDGPRDEPHDESAVRAWLVLRLARYLDRSAENVEENVTFFQYGLDSVAALSLYGDIEDEFGVQIEPTDIWEHPTIRDLARHIAVEQERRPENLEEELLEGEFDGVIRTAFVFTGLGSQHPGMTAGLYANSPHYRGYLDEVAEALLPYTGMSVVDIIRDGDPRIHQTAFAQPAMFAVEYALARTLQAAAIQPVAVVGHGIGEFAAAVIAEAVSLADAAKLVAVRGAFMQYLPSGGGMMATGASPQEASELAAGEPQVAIGAINAARATVLSGDRRGLERIQDQLELRGIACMPLNVSHAFQSPLMEPVLPRLTRVARRLGGAAPRLPYYSTVRGGLTAEPLYAAYWTEQVTAPVRFAEAVRQLLAQQSPTHVVEIGPSRVLTPLLRRMGGSRGPACVAVCRSPETNLFDLVELVQTLGGRLEPQSSPATSANRA